MIGHRFAINASVYCTQQCIVYYCRYKSASPIYTNKKCLLNVYSISNGGRKKKLFFGDVDKQKTSIYRSRPLSRSIRRGRINREGALDVRDRVENGETKLSLKNAILIYLAAPNFLLILFK